MHFPHVRRYPPACRDDRVHRGPQPAPENLGPRLAMALEAAH